MGFTTEGTNEPTMEPDRATWQRPASGVIAAGVAIGVAELLTALSGNPSLIVAVADRVIETTPAAVIRFAIDVFGTANRFVLSSVIAIVLLTAALSLGRWRARWPHADIATFSAFAAVAAIAALQVPTGSAPIGVSAAAIAAVAGVVTLRTLESRAATTQSSTAAASAVPHTSVVEGLANETRAVPLASPTDPPQPSRREFLTWATGLSSAAIVATGSGAVLRGRGQPAVPAAPTADIASTGALPPPGFNLEGLAPLITPNDQFYRIDTAFVPPRIDGTTHQISITGMVDRPLTLSYTELLDRASVEATVHLACVSNEVGGDLVGNAVWTGVSLAELLEEAGVQPEADQVVGRAVDGWTGGFPVDVIADGRPALVAVTMNGAPLPVAHGFPVRLVVAGLYGYVSDTKWLAEIELTRFDQYDAYWIERGWAREGPVKTQSRIDVPRRGQRLTPGATVIAGVAWAGERGIERVEVQIDDGSWREATLGEELSQTSWRQWRIPWDAQLGRHQVRVRATDGVGITQTEASAPPFPDGATGFHTVNVNVV